MKFIHEQVLLENDIPIKVFKFEGSEGNYSVAKHWHQCLELFFVRSGDIEFWINSQEYHLVAGDCILVNANQIHSIKVVDKNDVIVMQIPLSLMEKYDDNQRIVFKQVYGQDDDVLKNYINNIYEIKKEKPLYYEYKVLSEYYALIHWLLSKYMDKEAREVKLKYYKSVDRLSKVTDYIEENYTKDISLEDLAERFDFAPAYLSRLFKKCANINYKEYLDSVRLEHAYKELLNTNHTAAEITYNNGFPNNKSFIVAFKKQYGYTPGQYRKRVREGKL